MAPPKARTRGSTVITTIQNMPHPERQLPAPSWIYVRKDGGLSYFNLQNMHGKHNSEETITDAIVMGPNMIIWMTATTRATMRIHKLGATDSLSCKFVQPAGFHHWKCAGNIVSSICFPHNQQNATPHLHFMWLHPPDLRTIIWQFGHGFARE